MTEFTYVTFQISRKNVAEMFCDRGFNLTTSIHNRIAFTNALNNDKIEEMATRGTTQYMVVWFSHKVTIQVITALKTLREERSLSKIVIIADMAVTPKALKTIEVEKDIFELLSFKETQYNPTKHELVPNHRALSKTEKEEVLKDYDTNLENFPKILVTDPICRWYAWKPRTLVEITRQGQSISYRLVE